MTKWSLIFSFVVLITLCAKIYALYNRKFPENFKFGTATASYQIEGAWNADGKGESIWDRLTHVYPGYIADQSNGDIACNSYYKYKEDVKLMKDMSVKLYRFSISWPRIFPNGLPNTYNQKGVDYYSNLIDELLANDIEPIVTLYHWDLPQKLQDIGGWTNGRIVKYFTDYAKVLFENFSGKVKYWATFNEPISLCHSGYGDRAKAPVLNSSGLAEYQCTYNLLKSHASVYHLYNNQYREGDGKLGIVMNTNFYLPEDDNDESLAVQELAMQFTTGLYLHPIFHKDGNYPQIVIDRIAMRSKLEGFKISRLPAFTSDEINWIKGSADFLGVNHYTTNISQAIPEPQIGDPFYHYDKGYAEYQNSSWNGSASSWLKVVPEGFRGQLVWMRNEYDSPEMIITENGFSDTGELDDQGRINYYQLYLSALLEAIYDDGVNVTGYTAWSLLDNFEWMRGYTERFGLIHVNFTDDNRLRTPKASAEFYKKVIESRCLLEEGSCIE